MPGVPDDRRPGVAVWARTVGVVLALIAVVWLPAGSAAAAPDPADDESYPPDAIVNLIDPFSCAPDSITGDIGAVLAGSIVTLSLSINGADASTATLTAGADGHILYTLTVPPDRFGPANVRAEGTDTLGAPFVLDTEGTIVDCAAPPQSGTAAPPQTGSGALPQTGSNATSVWITFGLAAVMAGTILLTIASRRRRASA